MRFEFDPVKSVTNSKKHGIDFNQAQALWQDPQRIFFNAVSDSEPRYAIIARAFGRIWFAVFTIRNRKIRIISVRRARTKEERIYEKA